MNNLTDRQRKILNIIIEEYIKQAKPIGSIIVSKQLQDIGASTVRNEMSKLEEMGLLITDNFSGRIPSKELVLDYLKDFNDFEYKKFSEIELKNFCQKEHKCFFKYIKPEQEIIEMVFIYKISKEKILFTITTKSNLIYTKIIMIAEEIESLSILKINEILKKIFMNRALSVLESSNVSKLFSKYKDSAYYSVLENIVKQNIYEEITEQLFEKINCFNLLLLDLPIREEKEYFEIINNGDYKHHTIFVKNEKDKIFGIIGVI